MRPPTKKTLIGVGMVCWAVHVGLSIDRMMRYEFTPGPVAAASDQWPSTTFVHDTVRPTLVTVLHPECPCSRATVEEIAGLQAEFGDRLRAFAIVDASADELKSRAARWLLNEINATPGLTLVIDRDGTEAERFGAKVSGQTFMYDRAGRLRFSGGVTMSRGSVGPNAGSEAIRALMRGEASRHQSAVFGCVLTRGGQS